MSLPSWTVEQAMGHSPCYDEAQVRELWNGRESLTVLDVLALPISDSDKMWAAARMLDGTEAGERARIATLTRVITAYALPCNETREWAERWLRNENRDKAGAAEAAEAAWAAEAAGAAGAAEAAEAAEAAWAAEAAEAAAGAAWAAWAAEAAEAAAGAAEAAEAAEAAAGAAGAAEAAELTAQIADIRAAVEAK